MIDPTKKDGAFKKKKKKDGKENKRISRMLDGRNHWERKTLPGLFSSLIVFGCQIF